MSFIEMESCSSYIICLSSSDEYNVKSTGFCSYDWVVNSTGSEKTEKR